jgi:hypothetical protein
MHARCWLDRPPNRLDVEPPERGEVISIPVLGGMHPRYTVAYRSAALTVGYIGPQP